MVGLSGAIRIVGSCQERIRMGRFLSGACQEPVRTIRTTRKIKVLIGSWQAPVRSVLG